jgi:glucose-6-phosphate dehydrogenase assembly protein OpcA
MTNSPPVIALAEPLKVQVSQINKQLSRIWSSQNDGGATRASTFNLLVFDPGQKDPNAVTDTVGAIAVQHPCRAIVLAAAGEDLPEPGVEAFVAAYCPVSEAGNRETVCCEYVTLRARGQALVDIHTTAASLLLPELETILWWQSPLNPYLQLFTNLQKIVDRTIIDSTLFETPEKGLISFTNLVFRGDWRGSFGDLNWSRLTPWREEAALAFDSEERAACLGALDGVMIEYGLADGSAPNPVQALLFVGWLASRLGWQPLSVHARDGLRQIILTDADQRPIQATIRSVPAEAALCGQLTSVGLRSEQMGASCSTVLCSSDSTSCLRMQMNVGEALITQVSDVDTQTTKQLLSEALRTPDRDIIYEQSLAVVDQMLRLTK